MRPLRIALWVGALAALAAGASPARAAWDNVFQVCCHGCNNAPSTSGYYAGYVAAASPADACCPQPQPCPRQVCETRYEQRTYYTYETRYETRTAYDPVTTYQKSYYWEPVTSYRTSCYYDPCSCSYKQVSIPCTSYRMREQCCPVQSWVARCYSVPVTVAKPYTRCEPVTSCYWTTAQAPNPCPQQPGVPVSPQGGAGVNDTGRPPANGGQPGVNDSGDGSSSGFRGNDNRYDPGAKPQGLRQGQPSDPKTTPVRPDKFVSAPPRATLGAAVAVLPPNVEGEVVRGDRSPDAGARLTFKRAGREGETHTITADNAGRFKATLASGGWDVYTHRTDGQLVKQTTIDVREDRTSQVRLTSR